MNIALRRAMTVAEYLAWVEAQGEVARVELINGQVVFMSPELVVHNMTKGARSSSLCDTHRQPPDLRDRH